MLRDPRKHARTDLFTVVESENEIGPTRSGKRLVRAGLALDRPSGLEKRRQDAFRLGRGPLAH